mgnify:CR=1 FL=1|nr:MAG TPA: hypothetical protein [Caudoviricetes sp.]
MKVNVIKEFVDRYTGELHTVGSSFECDKNRFKEIEKAGKYVEPVIETETKKVTK